MTNSLSENEIRNGVNKLEPEWNVINNNKLLREFKFEDFKQAMDFVDKVAILAEDEGHHPDIHIYYNKVKIELWTHSVNGISEKDFVLAEKIELIS